MKDYESNINLKWGFHTIFQPELYSNCGCISIRSNASSDSCIQDLEQLRNMFTMPEKIRKQILPKCLKTKIKESKGDIP